MPSDLLALQTLGQFHDTTGDFPDAANVTTDDTTNGVAGTLTLPTAAQVQIGVQFGGGGTEYTGTLLVPGGLSPTSSAVGGHNYTAAARVRGQAIAIRVESSADGFPWSVEEIGVTVMPTGRQRRT